MQGLKEVTVAARSLVRHKTLLSSGTMIVVATIVRSRHKVKAKTSFHFSRYRKTNAAADASITIKRKRKRKAVKNFKEPLFGKGNGVN